MINYNILNKRHVNFPVYHGIDEYHEVIHSIVNQIKRSPDIKSIYQVGSIGCPGISDIDLFLVLNDNVQNNYKTFSAQRLCNREERYFFPHDAAFINEILFENICEWNPTSSLKKLHGKDIKIKKGINQKNINDLVILIRTLIAKIPRVIIHHLYHTNVIDICLLIRQLYSFKHTIALYNKITGDNNSELQSMTDELTMIRDLWFKNDTKTNLNNLNACINNFVNALAYLIIGFTLHLRKFDFINNFTTQLKKYDEIKFPHSYLETYFIQCDKSFDFLRNSIDQANGSKLYLPLELSYLIYCHKDSKTRLKDFTYNRIKEFSNVNCDNMFVNNIRYVDEYVSFSKKIGYRGLVCVDFCAGDSYIISMLRVLRKIIKV